MFSTTGVYVPVKVRIFWARPALSNEVMKWLFYSPSHTVQRCKYPDKMQKNYKAPITEMEF